MSYTREPDWITTFRISLRSSKEQHELLAQRREELGEDRSARRSASGRS